MDTREISILDLLAFTTDGGAGGGTDPQGGDDNSTGGGAEPQITLEQVLLQMIQMQILKYLVFSKVQMLDQIGLN